MQRLIWILLSVSLGLSGCASTPRNPWSKFNAPARGKVQSIGGYSAGCVVGAASIEPSGLGYQVMRVTRGRFYGHPNLITFIRAFGETVAKQKMGVLLIGDISQPRGGPTLTGHRSHQTGLDVDIWFWQFKDAMTRSLTLGEREVLNAPSMVRADGESLSESQWGETQIRMLRLAAAFPEVERIFVNPAIKRELCIHEKDHAWLEKIRPWWGHDSHFHVRLRCPAGDTQCLPQEAITKGSGCDDALNWWFSAEAKEIAQKPAATPEMPELPAACKNVSEDLDRDER